MTSSFENIDLEQPDEPVDQIIRENKKSVRYDNDPEILLRLATVAEMMHKRRKAHEIAAKMQCSLATAKRDIARVRALWRAANKLKIDDLRAESQATYEAVIAECWVQIAKLPEKADRFLTVIALTQSKLDELTGAKKAGIVQQTNVQINNNEVVEDIDETRKRRWEQVTRILPQMQTIEITQVATGGEKP